jgi:hypothetical protein
MTKRTEGQGRHDKPSTDSARTEGRPSGMSRAQLALAKAQAMALSNAKRLSGASARSGKQQDAEPSPNSVADGEVDQDFYPEVRIEIRVSFREESQGIEVPLGYYRDGSWCPFFLSPTEEGLWMEPDEVAHWLATAADLGDPFFEHPGEAEAIVDATVKRCLALARANADECKRVAGLGDEAAYYDSKSSREDRLVQEVHS